MVYQLRIREEQDTGDEVVELGLEYGDGAVYLTAERDGRMMTLLEIDLNLLVRRMGCVDPTFGFVVDKDEKIIIE